MPVGGSKFELEKTWRSTGVGTQTFNSPGTFTMNYGKQNVYVQGTGGTGGGGTGATYNTSAGNIATYNQTYANYNVVAGPAATYLTPVIATYTQPSYNTATYNPTPIASYSAGNVIYGSPVLVPSSISGYNAATDVYYYQSTVYGVQYTQVSYTETPASFDIFYDKNFIGKGTDKITVGSFLNYTYGNAGAYTITSGNKAGTLCYSLGRAPDEGGATYWVNQMISQGFTPAIDAFFGSILASGTNNQYEDYTKTTTNTRTISVTGYGGNPFFFIDVSYYTNYPGQALAYSTYNYNVYGSFGGSPYYQAGVAYPYSAPTSYYYNSYSTVPYYIQTQTNYLTYYIVRNQPYYAPGNANYNSAYYTSGPATGNYNAPSPATYNQGSPATYSVTPGTGATYNQNIAATYSAPTYPIAGYNATTGDQYYAPSYPIATYNQLVAGNPSSALGITLPGGPGGNQPVPVTGPTEISYYGYPDNASYPVTVASGGQVVIKTN